MFWSMDLLHYNHILKKMGGASYLLIPLLCPASSNCYYMHKHAVNVLGKVSGTELPERA